MLTFPYLLCRAGGLISRKAEARGAGLSGRRRPRQIKLKSGMGAVVLPGVRPASLHSL